MKPVVARKIAERLKRKSQEQVLYRASAALNEYGRLFSLIRFGIAHSVPRMILAGPYPRGEDDGEVIYPIIMGISYANPNLDRRATQCVVLDANVCCRGPIPITIFLLDLTLFRVILKRLWRWLCTGPPDIKTLRTCASSSRSSSPT